MNELENHRRKLDEIDRRMAELLEERLTVAEQIGQYKKENHLPVLDEKREQAILDRAGERIKNKQYLPVYLTFQQTVMDLCKTVQSDLPLSCRFESITDFLDTLPKEKKVLVLWDKNVPIAPLLQRENFVLFPFDATEENKTLATAETVWQEMIARGFHRDDCVLAVGGGITCDLGGFVASAYMRGVDFYSAPTTLLAMVDAAYGGKTAVNQGNLKNMLGAFYPAKAICYDLSLLKTLPQKQMQNGMAEVIKMALTLDKNFFETLEEREPYYDLSEIVRKSLALKYAVVQQDGKEKGVRRVLNFGHTLGHAMELLPENTYLHGECVAVGMLPFVDEKIRPRLETLLEKYNLPLKPNGSKNALISGAEMDKKQTDSGLYEIFCHKIGKADIQKISMKEWQERVVKTFYE